MSRPAPAPPAVYAIADADMLGAERLPAAVAAFAAAGVRWIQLRAKRLPDAAWPEVATACRRATADHGARLWIDDRADVARLLAVAGVEVAGVHLGADDLPPAAARRVVGEATWIGRSTHDEAQVRAADADPEVDVVAFGPIYPTSSKAAPDPVVGLAGLRRARRATGKPLVAIGGIDAGRVREVLAAGADTAAVLGAVCRGDGPADWRADAERLLAAAREAA